MSGISNERSFRAVGRQLLPWDYFRVVRQPGAIKRFSLLPPQLLRAAMSVRLTMPIRTLTERIEWPAGTIPGGPVSEAIYFRHRL